MHYTYGISRRQVCHVSSPWLCCKTRLLQDVTLCVHFLSLKENWSHSADTLHSLACMIICWNEKEKQLWSFQHPNLPRVTNHKQNAVKKLKHTWAKLGRTGTLIFQKCPKLNSIGMWILDLLPNKTCVPKKWSHEQTLVPCCVIPIGLYHFYEIVVKLKATTPTSLVENRSFPSCLFTVLILKREISCKMLNSDSLFFSLKENWSESVDTLRLLASLTLCWNEKE